jgi:hypothetical protein
MFLPECAKLHLRQIAHIDPKAFNAKSEVGHYTPSKENVINIIIKAHYR